MVNLAEAQPRRTTLETAEVRKAPGTFARIRTSFRQSWLALLSLVVLTVILAAALAAPLIGRYDPTDTDLTTFEQRPSAAHWLGTDSAGRDVWSRLIWGSRNSLLVGIVAVTLTTA